MKTKTFACLSDIHGDLSFLPDPCDFLLISGDICPLGIDTQPELSEKWLKAAFIPYLEECLKTATHVVWIAGNHDFVFDRADKYHHRIDSILRMMPVNTHYLQDSSVTIDGINFYGSPYTPWFWDWAFNLPPNDFEFVQQHWSNIPNNTHVLLTHGPPAGILDANAQGMPCGCPDLLDRIGQLKCLKLHNYGHLHDSYGMRSIGGVVHVNSAIGYNREKSGRGIIYATNIEI